MDTIIEDFIYHTDAWKLKNSPWQRMDHLSKEHFWTEFCSAIIQSTPKERQELSIYVTSFITEYKKGFGEELLPNFPSFEEYKEKEKVPMEQLESLIRRDGFINEWGQNICLISGAVGGAILGGEISEYISVSHYLAHISSAVGAVIVSTAGWFAGGLILEKTFPHFQQRNIKRIQLQDKTHDDYQAALLSYAKANQS